VPPKTLLAIDDSPTMRKVLEITFAGEDFRVVAADSSQAALASMNEGPVAAVNDTSLEGSDGYALAKELRARDPRLAIVLLSSRYNPYDPNRGREAGADDYTDKPFDTQALIDKVKKAIQARETTKQTATPIAAPPAPAAHVAGPMGGAQRPPLSPTGIQRPASATQRTHTLSFESSPPAGPAIARTTPSGAPIVQPQQIRAAGQPLSPAVTMEHMVRTAVPPRPGEAAPAVAAAMNGQLANKLGDLGLTPEQVEGVLALSRDVVERVVWEVVPQLAEALIKEEIARLTKDG
jgi:CheY-like chemotaxis protein